MYRTPCTVVLLSLIAAAASAQAPARPMTFDDIMALRQAGSPVISPDGQQVVFAVNAWEHPNAKPDSGKADTARGDKHEQRSHLWIVPSAGGATRQLTFSERGESQPAWAPDGKTLAFISARGSAVGDEPPKAQIWVLPFDGGEAWQLTTAREGVSSFSWSPDGNRVAYLVADTMPKIDEAKRKRKDDPLVFEANHRLAHVWVTEVATKHATEVAHGDFTVRGAPSWSPDGSMLAFSSSPTPLIRDSRSDAYVVSIATRKLERVSPASDVSSNPVWAPDGQTLAYTILPNSHAAHGDSIMERELGNEHIILYDVRARKTTDAYDPKMDVSAGQLRWSPDGARLTFTSGERAYSALYAYDVASRKLARVIGGTLMRGLSWSKDGRRVAYAMETTTSPADIYVSDAGFATPRKLTTLNPQVANFALGQTEVVMWKSDDGTPVEGVLLKPVGYQAGTRYPLLVEAHGGPTGATGAGFKAGSGSPGQVWAGEGWAVFYPNPRGSTNYGEKFMRANIMDWGGGDYRDIMTGVDHLIQKGIADSTKMAFAGWSYGGYMTAWVVTQTSRFKAARMGAGLSDLQSMYGTTDIPGYIGTFFKGMPTKETLEFYRARSAITFVDNVTTPLLILHGGNDERVPTGQAMELYRALKDRGKIVELVFYPREGHGLSEYYHQVDRMRREHEWITRYTLGGGRDAKPVTSSAGSATPRQ
ncbi:MAG: prolyl oligopeptidase family serine peptidase [Gemmatimonadaceae bacterium]